MGLIIGLGLVLGVALVSVLAGWYKDRVAPWHREFWI